MNKRRPPSQGRIKAIRFGGEMTLDAETGQILHSCETNEQEAPWVKLPPSEAAIRSYKQIREKTP